MTGAVRTGEAESSVSALVTALAESAGEVSQVRALPPAAYTSEELFDLEREAFLDRGWLAVGRADRLREPGDYIALTVYGEPLVAVRAEDGSVAVMSAVCRHRGMPVLEGEGHCGTRIRCPLHGWTYGLDGRLLAAPEMHRTVPLDRLKAEVVGLVALRTVTWLGFVLVNVGGGAPPLRESVRRADEHLANWDLESLVQPEPARELPHLTGNWKTIHEGGLEPYHTPFLHGDKHALIPPDATTWFPREPGETFVLRSTGVADGIDELPTLFTPRPRLTAQQRSQLTFVSLPPTLYLSVADDHLLYFHLLPESADYTTVRVGFCFDPTDVDSEGFAARIELLDQLMEPLFQEDVDANRRLQEARRSRFAPRGPLSHQERPLPDFAAVLTDMVQHRGRRPDGPEDEAPMAGG